MEVLYIAILSVMVLFTFIDFKVNIPLRPKYILGWYYARKMFNIEHNTVKWIMEKVHEHGLNSPSDIMAAGNKKENARFIITTAMEELRYLEKLKKLADNIYIKMDSLELIEAQLTSRINDANEFI